ncbi:MAG: alanine racemase [Oscillospiraceae bacterium]
MPSRPLDATAARGYPALDVFRVVAAFLVVANHTSPLFSVNETADFVLTRVIARLAVPFFFMASGFFLAQKPGRRAVGPFVRKLLGLYGLCIFLYLPLNVYMGTFSGAGWPLAFLRDIVWNGTLYHLWYFPAAALGVAIAWLLYRHCRPLLALGLAGLLYLVGVGGASWYGFASQLSIVKNMYDALFVLFDYTRNGLFFAPLFVLLGLYAAGQAAPRRRALWDILLFAVSMALMLAEALWLRGAFPMRHDSMYLALPFCAWFLFALLRRVRGVSLPALRRVATIIYIVHPWFIVLVRGAAKLFKVEKIVIDMSPVFFVCVALCSLATALLLRAVPPFWRGLPRRKTRRTWAEVDGDALDHNLAQLSRLMAPGCQMMAVVKADAYGHGAVWAARRLQRRGVRAFAVATLEEGIYLRRCGVWGTILVLGHTAPCEARRLRFYRLTQTVVDAAHAKALSAQRVCLKVHIKVDTGMHRLGAPTASPEAIADIYALGHLHVTGIYTHLARADSLSAEDERFTDGQIADFYRLLEALARRGIAVGKTHLQSSYGLLNRPGLPCDYVRVGIALYGALAAGTTRNTPQLRPVMALKTRVASVRQVPAGAFAGYGTAHRCTRATRLAALPAGYADGVPRALRGGHVWVAGALAPVVGAICMDQMLLDVGALDVQPGDEVVLFGGENAPAVAEWAAQSGTIPNEVLARLGQRVPRCVLPRKAAAQPAAQRKKRRAATSQKRARRYVEIGH